MFVIRRSRPEDLDANFEVWRTSVEATHTFLSARDLADISALVRDEYLPGADLLVAVDESDAPRGFMGVTGHHIDSLFVHSISRGAGIGRLLVHRILDERATITVDVNEQNTFGLGFYKHMGFKICGRSEHDDQCRPYPLLHLRRAARDKAVIS